MLHAVSTYVRVHAKSSPLIFGAPFLSLSLACLSPRNLLSTSFALASSAAAAYLLAVSASLFTHSRQEGGFIFGFQQARRRKKVCLTLSLSHFSCSQKWVKTEWRNERRKCQRRAKRERESIFFAMSVPWGAKKKDIAFQQETKTG